MDVLPNLLQLQPNLILQPDFRDQILSKLSFQEFLSEIYKFPDIYEKLSTDQQYWREYLQINYPDLYSKIIITPTINWFYETIKATFSDFEYYLIAKSWLHTVPLMNFISDFVKPKNANYFNIIGNPDIHYLDNAFSMLNRIPFSNIKQMMNNTEYSFVLLENGDLLEIYRNSVQQLLLSNIEKILSDKNFYFFLTTSGELYRKQDETLRKLIFPFKIKNIQMPYKPNLYSSYNEYISIIDNEDNLYLINLLLGIDFTDDDDILNPVLRNVPIISHSFIKYKTNIFQIGTVTTTVLSYITADNLLFSVLFDSQNQNDIQPRQVNTYNNVLVKNVWIQDIVYLNINQTLLFYQDLSGNIYQTVDGMLQSKYQLPKDEKVIQFFVVHGNKLIFITDIGRFYLMVHINSIDNIINVNVKEYKDFPAGTTILEDAYFSTVLKVPKQSDHIFIPYAIYLYYLQNKKVISDKIKEQNIIFTIANSPYLFQTKIE